MKCSWRTNMPDASVPIREWLRKLFAERELCGAPAEWVNHMGEALCDAHAEESVARIARGESIESVVILRSLKERGEPASPEVIRGLYLRRAS